MAFTHTKLNRFLLFKLPSAWLCGVRVTAISSERCTTSVAYKWINQNPFNSMFWAVQGMAAELSTGAIVMLLIQKSNKKISMLVLNNKASFTKKAQGRITFSCKDGRAMASAVARAIDTGEAQTCWMTSTGIDQSGAVVSVFDFEWTVKVKREEM